MKNHSTVGTPMDRSELTRAVVLGSATLFAAVAIVVRLKIGPVGVADSLMLVAASWLSAALLFLPTAHTIERAARHWFAAAAVVALIAWSPNVAFGLMAICPALSVILGPLVLTTIGFEIWLQQAGPGSGNLPRVNSPGESEPEITACHSPEHPAQIQIPSSVVGESLSNLDSLESGFPQANAEETGDIWSRVQEQFGNDQSLDQNVTRWSQQDGSASVVANVRCQLSTVDQTSTIQIPFWPVLEQMPEVFCRVANDAPATITCTKKTCHGLRMEVKLKDRSSSSTAQLPINVLAEVVATCEASIVDAGDQAA